MKPRYEQPGLSDGTTFTCFVRRERSYEFAWHQHREYELTLITEGAGTRYVGTTVERYQPGDLVLLGPDLPHTFASRTGDDWAGAVVIQFRHEFLGPDFFALPQFQTVDRLLTRCARGLKFGRAPHDMQALLTRMPRLEAAARTVALLDILQRLAATTTAAQITGPGYAPAPGTATAMSNRIDTVCGYLQQAHTAPVHLADVAALVHMSPTSFSRFFSRAMGRTLTDYVNQVRIETACDLLTATALPVTEVAARSGFRSLSNFNRRFRELKALRPTDYRAAHARRLV
ncbi:MAG TPA: AraC family transcriptional regulator [Actinocrinis sp.]|jgi:AraC-like DNA-binding protein